MAKKVRNRKQQATRTAQTNQGQSLLKQLEQQCKRLPNNPAVWKGLAAWHLQEGDIARALSPAKRAFELAPEDASIAVQYAAALRRADQINKAIEVLTLAYNTNQKDAKLCNDLALMHYNIGQYQAALNVCDSCLGTNLEQPGLLQLKASALKALHRLEKAKGLFEHLAKLQPADFRHWMDIGNIERDLGNLDRALECYQQAMTLSGDDASAYSNYLTTLHYHPDKSRDEIFKACKLWQEQYAPAWQETEHKHLSMEPEKKLRIGLISDGFKRSPVGQMITSVLEAFPKEQADFIAFSSNDARDDITTRIANCCSEWHRITQLFGPELFEHIKSQKIDILIDLAGHNNGSRMSAIAMKPAPIIIKWVGGLINTTAVDAIDYLLSDHIETPTGHDQYYTEKLIKMPHDYICYDPPEYTPAVNTLPALNNEYITFGCFNNPTKINKVILSCWADIMHLTPNSRLLLKSFQFNSPELVKRITQEMEAMGIDKDRLILEGPSPHQELLRSYNRVDIALDTWPYSGGLTTCEAMLMGVPVVTCTGPTFAGRHSASHIKNAGMYELVTDSFSQYKTRVLELTSDLSSLSIIRENLRTIFLQSNVCADKEYANTLSIVLRTIWRRHAKGLATESISCTETRDKVQQDLSNPLQSEEKKSREISSINPNKKTFVHLCFNNMHSEPLLDTLSNGKYIEGYNSIIFIEKTRAVVNYDVDITKNNSAYFFNASDDLHDVIKTCLHSNVTAVFIHGIFFEWQLKAIEKINGEKPCIWTLWGGDLYGNLNNNDFIGFVNNNISYVATSLDDEIRIFNDTFSPKPSLEIKYDFGYEDIPVPEIKEKLIFVGNSGDPSNNHIDILRSLALKQDIKNYTVIIPYTYNGNDESLISIKEEIKNLGIKNVHILTKHLKKSDYYKVLGSAEIYISAHNRQQGFGHVAACFYFGVSVVMRKEITVSGLKSLNPVWSRVILKQGFFAHDYEEFKKAHTIESMNNSELTQRNKSLSRRIYGRQSSADTFAQAYKQLSDAV
ncbi:TDP-N-acetylfucosamine:lipid II N-acetylfucosaminyltransferase [Marinobacterium stanieri]|uniref:TDP-N-acetylfucosamine:lipid II N-acetylfucosaminyltransferase n=1 Tax=Marinobacterium stanieri TaxID=49186 RepID=UPI000255A935|nr:TDP-N-acetylfucosamine:lipid II N-acetylfucosaminyltransferase [Marinobacterium stanieri]